MPVIVQAVPVDFTYHQRTGEMWQGNVLVGKGHAGNGVGENAPDQQEVHKVGPLPRGRYTIQFEACDKTLGIVAMRLTPHPDNQMFNRDGFFIHAPWFSEGCIALDLEPRCIIAEAVRHGRDQLEVV